MSIAIAQDQEAEFKALTDLMKDSGPMADEDDEKTVIKQLLDADDDGKLSFEDAKAIAAKMAASARKRLVTLLDEDGDGEISWAEIEGGARGAFHRCEEALTRAWRVLDPHKTKLLAGVLFRASTGPISSTPSSSRDPSLRRPGRASSQHSRHLSLIHI